MDINIVASKCSELSDRYIFSLLKNRDKSKRHIIIAPDRSLFSLEQRLFQETKESCFFDVDVYSLTRLSKFVLNREQHNRILTKQSGVALIKKLLIDNMSKLAVFKKASSFLGFASSLFETICLYKSCGIKPQGVYVTDSQDYSNLKQKDIKLIYTLYEQYLENDYTDSFNQLQLFADKINNKSFENTVFYFVEFEDYTSIAYNIIAKLAQFSEGFYITCNYGKHNNNHNIYTNKVYYDLIDLFKFNNLEYKVTYTQDFEDIIHRALSNNVFAYAPASITGENSGIRINSFDNINDEITYTIADIYSDALVSQKDFSNYILVVPSVARYRNIINREVMKYNIPVYFDENKLLIDHILPRTIFDFCEIIKGNFELYQYTNLIKNPIFNLNIDDVLLYENKLKRLGAKPYQCLSSKYITTTEIQEFVDMVSGLRSAKDIERSWSYFLEEVISKIYDYMLSRVESYRSGLTPLELRTYNQVINKIDSINKDFLQVFSDTISSFDDFLESYMSYYQSTNISMPPITSNTLLIADFNSSYIPQVSNLYVLGCNEGVMPKYQLDNGLVTDEEISRLPNAKKINPTISMINKRKQFKLFDILLKYTSSLNLSYLNSDNEGKLYSNSLIGSITKILGIREKNCSLVLDTIDNSLREININNIVFNNLNKKVALDNVLKFAKFWDTYQEYPNYRVLLTTLYNSLEDESVSKLISEEMIKYPTLDDVDFFHNNSTSVSQIECYNNCPYKHFVRYGLKLKENAEYKLLPKDIGTIIHEVLREIVPMMLNDKDLEALKIEAHQILDNVLHRDEYVDLVNNSINRYVIKSLYREIDRIIVSLVREITSSSFKPKYYEYRLGNNAFSINGVDIKGSIDRVDVSDKDYIIIDYKTGDSSFANYNDIVSGKKLQLLVYAKAFQNNTQYRPAGAFYIPLQNKFNEEHKLSGVMLKDESNLVAIDNNLSQYGEKSSIIDIKRNGDGKFYSNLCYKNMCLSVDDFNYLLDYTTKQVAKSIDRIKAGEIQPYPIIEEKKSVCDYCTYKAICYYQENNPNEVKVIPSIEDIRNIGAEDGGI